MNTTKRILLSLVFAAGAMVPRLTSAATWAAEVDNANGASNVLSISALLCGTLTSTGGVPTQAQVFWGTSDGGTAVVLWAHTSSLGTNSVGPLSLAVTDLVPNHKYYYRFYATNANGQAWAAATTNFQTLLSAGPAPVNLGSTAHFTILAGAAITTTGGGTIQGDVGASPIGGSAIHLTAAQVNGTIYVVDAGGPAGSVIDVPRLTAAMGDLKTAYNEARDRTPVPTGPFLNPGAGNIGGLTLVPGLYKFTGQAHLEGSDVTLTGGPNDVWIFQVASELIVEAGVNRSVILAGGAKARNIFWQVGTSATLGTFSVFKGTVLADQAITMDTSSTMEGRALAFTAGVTYNGQGGALPSPDAPSFAGITTTASNSTTVVLSTTPYFPATMQSSPDVSATNWTTIATGTPASNYWTFIHANALTGATHRFYRAYLTSY